ncbi:hypothetical protein R1flu_016107 [Riccia fluitans]|uniref:Uncharacterized protein n=1 Tax=Riccia fluitans TaxID=41844 RepID=A0ABD1YKW5_9MARC
MAELKVQLAVPKEKRKEAKALRHDLWCSICHNQGHTKEKCRLPKASTTMANTHWIGKATTSSAENYYAEGADGHVYHVSMTGAFGTGPRTKATYGRKCTDHRMGGTPNDRRGAARITTRNKKKEESPPKKPSTPKGKKKRDKEVKAMHVMMDKGAQEIEIKIKGCIIRNIPLDTGSGVNIMTAQTTTRLGFINLQPCKKFLRMAD